MGISKDILLAVGQQNVDLLHRIADRRYGHIVVDSCDEVSGVLGAVNIKVPVALQQLRLTVGQIGSQDSSQGAILHSFVKFGKAAGKQREGCVADDVLCATLLQLAGNLQHGLTGSNDVIRNENSLAFHALTQILVGDDGVTAIDNAGVVTALWLKRL